ncbi:class I SAM-dependent methyltransferase [Nitrospira sp. Nam80]
MIAVASRRLLTKPLEGVGIEIGAGCGILSSLVARGQSIKQIYALEVVEKMALSIIPRVAAHVLGWGQTKITPVWGSFDDLRLPDNSIDFVIEIDSLHHSDNLSTTVSECARVLKPGGWLLCFDRCHPNSVTDEEVDKMLSRIYSPEFLTANCYPSDIILSRRDNGEHEYRLYEWEAAFAAAQLQLVSRLKLHKRVAVRHAMKGLASVLPDPIRRRVYNTENASLAAAKLWLFQRLGFSSVAAKEETIFLLKKAA